MTALRALGASSSATAITLLLWCSPAAAAQTNDCAALPLDTRIVEIGAFSNMRYTEEHAYGYSVMLWSVGDCVIGFFESSQGLAGDTPIGELRDVRFDRKTGRLSFSVKLTMGVTGVRGSNAFEPSRDTYVFEGDLKSTQLTGQLTYVNQNNPGFTPVREDVALRPSKEEAEFMGGSSTYGEWREKWRAILQARGPKW